ncbi:MAG: sphingomyelin phosphodiesterase [Bacteroidota bacterium]
MRPAPVAPGGSESGLRILSWNIYMLPRFAKITGKRRRSRAIAELLKDTPYDIIVLQEAFLGDARRILKRELEDAFPYTVGPANRKFSIKTNSGIWILSKLRLRTLGEIDFRDCAGFDDCMARKGALLVETVWQGDTVQVLGTHLQAGGPHEIRHRQYAELRTLLDAHRRPDIPQIICGDMNTAQNDSVNYTYMIRTLDAEDGPLRMAVKKTENGYRNDMHRGGYRNDRIIDYIFYRGNGRTVSRIVRTAPHFRFPWSRRHADLSDHFPVAAKIWW